MSLWPPDQHSRARGVGVALSRGSAEAAVLRGGGSGAGLQGVGGRSFLLISKPYRKGCLPVFPGNGETRPETLPSQGRGDLRGWAGACCLLALPLVA